MARLPNIKMEDFGTELFDKMVDELAVIKGDENKVINLAERSLQVCSKYYQELQEYAATYKFSNLAEEIYFYKTCKPKLNSRSIYYYKLLKIEIGKPVTDTRNIEGYLLHELGKLNEFFDDNRFFYQYYRTGATYLDEKLFCRNAENSRASLFIRDITVDPTCESGCDYIVAKITANDLLQEYLQGSLDDINGTPKSGTAASVNHSILRWTESKTGLIELAYALKAIGAFNDGKADVKQIIEFFETYFSIDLGNTSRMFQSILSRKSGYSNFIDRLKEKLLQRIDSIEERHVR
jgi:hypothetical protein